MLYERALLLAKVESTFGTDASPTPQADAMLVTDPNFTVKVTQLERTVAKPDLSPFQMKAGRKVATVEFTHEVRGSGDSTLAVAPKIGRLLRGSGMAETNVTSEATVNVSSPLVGAGNVSTIVWTLTTPYTGAVERVYTVECSLAGASGSAKFDITSPASGSQAAVNETAVTATSASPITLSDGATITPTWSGSLSLGDNWVFDASPAGWRYDPVSDTFDSLTLYVYYDGLEHIVTGARGTFSVDGTGGAFATMKFTFTGNYSDPTDVALPTNPVYEPSIPTQVELANLEVGTYINLVASKFTIDIANDVQIRENINASNAYAGALIVGRKPVATIDPETVLGASHPVWALLSAGTPMTFNVRVGTQAGNIVAFTGQNSQYTDVKYGNRSQQRTNDITLNMARTYGNDELSILIS